MKHSLPWCHCVIVTTSLNRLHDWYIIEMNNEHMQVTIGVNDLHKMKEQCSVTISSFWFMGELLLWWMSS